MHSFGEQFIAGLERHLERYLLALLVLVLSAALLESSRDWLASLDRRALVHLGKAFGKWAQWPLLGGFAFYLVRKGYKRRQRQKTSHLAVEVRWRRWLLNSRRLHMLLGVGGLFFVLVHTYLLWYRWAHFAIPSQTVATGVLAVFSLLGVVGFGFQLRRQPGVRWWRRLHWGAAMCLLFTGVAHRLLA